MAALGAVCLLIFFAGCGGSTPIANKDGGSAGSSAGASAGGSGGDQSGAGGDMSGTAGTPAGAAGDTGMGTAGMIGGAGMTGGAGQGGGAGAGGGAAGKGGTAGKGGGAGAGGTTGNRDAGAGDAGALPACKHATTCAAGDPSPCVRACGAGRDDTCECGTGALAGKLVCETTCQRPDAGATDGGAVMVCPATIRSGTTACRPRTESTCETACQAAMHRECTCVATTAGAGVWFCFKPTACQ
jgi:hypothetical protein